MGGNRGDREFGGAGKDGELVGVSNGEVPVRQGSFYSFGRKKRPVRATRNLLASSRFVAGRSKTTRGVFPAHARTRIIGWEAPIAHTSRMKTKTSAETARPPNSTGRPAKSDCFLQVSHSRPQRQPKSIPQTGFQVDNCVLWPWAEPLGTTAKVCFSFLVQIPSGHVAGGLPQPFRHVLSRGALDKSKGASALAKTTSPPEVPGSRLSGTLPQCKGAASGTT